MSEDPVLMNPLRRLRARRRATDEPARAEATSPPADDAARQVRQAVSPERFDRPLLQFLDPA